ncbi:6-hydroxymethylpterin diphosphokinase MptE-like protein [Mucilaginibacter sp.]|uniref:6-hydroxymethylpterin diphosphokinase MptE-like protein n=1 Tax=Mucilaginibacter sp. TaxID=1882438 RepID=UPI0032655EE1
METNKEHPILSASDSINIYRQAGFMLANRLKWDLNPLAWSSRSTLRKLKNSQAGKKAVIICNGPSLLQTDFSLLKDTYTFGLNKINLLFDREDFRPNAIVSVNAMVIEQNKDFYEETSIPLFLDSAATSVVKKGKNVTFLHSGQQFKFARDVSMSVWQGATVTTVALQLAFHMGFSKVAVIGCDHNFAEKGSAGKTVVSSEKDESHFDPRYFAGGVKWQLPDIPTSEFGYYLARENFEASGRELYNCTVGGKLELFKRLDLKDFINS